MEIDDAGDRDEIVLGVLASPGLPAEVAGQLAQDLPALLGQRVSDRIRWVVPVHCEQLPGTGDSAVELIEEVRRRMLAESWDLAVYLADVPVRNGRRPVVADASATHRVALVSLPALGALGLRRRAGDAVVRLVDGLLGESLELDAHHGEQREARIARRLGEIVRPIREVTPDDDDIDVRYVAAVVRGHLRLLAGMIRANRPWRLIAGLSRALAAAMAAVAFALVTSDMWRLADALDWPRLLALTIGSLVILVVSLIAAHDLWERPRDPGHREQAVLFNAATVATVALGVASLYAALFVLTVAGAGLVIDNGLLARQVGHAAGLSDYLGLGWLVSSLATVGGALGAAVESDVAVRRAAYGYRRERQSERDAG